MKRTMMGLAVAAVGLATLFADGMSSTASAQPCGYPPFPPCPPVFIPPPPPPPRPYYDPYYEPRRALGNVCQVPGRDCELDRPVPVGSYCVCRGREGRVVRD